MKFGKVIASFRKKAGIEQKTLAEALNISATYLSLLENDRDKKPSIGLLSSIANYFGVPISLLFYEALKTESVVDNKKVKASFDAAEPVIGVLLDYLLTGKEIKAVTPINEGKKVRLKKTKKESNVDF